MGAQLYGERGSRQVARSAAPFIIVALAGIAVRTSLAAAHPVTALLLFLWIVSDTTMVSLVARTADRRPSRGAIVAGLAGASCTVWLGSPPIIRHTLWGMPSLAGATLLLVLAHVTWGAVRARRVLHSAGGAAADRWTAAASEILPAALVRLTAAELSVIHMALFRWGGPADIPPRCRAFSYHKHLTPMCTALLILSGIETAVYHLLVGHWSRTAAVFMFVFSDVGFVYLVGLIKSFRFRPVLVTPEGIRVRGGFLFDQLVPFDVIAAVSSDFAGETVRDGATLNAALLAWPNILVTLTGVVNRRSPLKSKRSFSSIAFRLDDPEPFVRLLRWRLGREAG